MKRSTPVGWGSVIILAAVLLTNILGDSGQARKINDLQQQISAEHERVTQAQIEIIKLQHQDVTAAAPVPTSHCTLHDIYVQNPGC